MDIRITTITSLTKAMLNTSRLGKIHSVYRKTINIQVSGFLLSLQAASSPVSPLSLITPLTPQGMEELQISKGQTVRFGNGKILVDTPKAIHSFNYSEAVIFDSVLAPSDLTSCIPFLEPALRNAKATGFRPIFFPVKETDAFPSDQFLINSAAANRISACTRHFRSSDYRDAASELVHLIGLGIGLTPSGDDFLCGVLAGLVLTGNSSHPFALALKEETEKKLSNTNDISGSFLKCAIISHFSQAVKNLAKAASPKALLSSFEEIGHSSGIDTLCGIYYVLTLFHEQL